jgi:hypothetical protein
VTETEFIESIDCQFPYDAEEKWRSLIEQGARISPNAAFMVLHELCRPPSGVLVYPHAIEAMLKHWCQQFEHPLVEAVLPAAEAMIKGKGLPADACMEIMRSVAAYQDQYNALAIPYFACDDTEGKVDEFYQAIIANWHRDVQHY